jgi:iron(III) transport system ATP-binding protein
MRGEIRRICKDRGLTAIYVTHDQKEALSIADRIAVMLAGRIVQVGTPEELYRRPANRFVADFLGATNFISARVVSVEDARLRLDSPVGTLTATGGGQVRSGARPGMTAVCSIRPEAIHLGPAPAGVMNVGEGTIEQTTYLGEVAEHRIRVGETGLKVFELHPAPAVVGRSARYWIDEADVIVIGAEA